VELTPDSFGEEDKTLTTASGETMSYSTLIIATAARVLKLDEFGVTGADAKNVCYLQDVQDAARLVDVIAALKGSAVDARVVERRAGAG
jgi:monodehydroascorbate reductase (NADH)